ncbi:MAG TPA: DUF4162 domain-containing protein [Aquihabitans sp.]|nr:DUF4162 domain-containing protein [Aquihabitans sp.]
MSFAGAPEAAAAVATVAAVAPGAEAEGHLVRAPVHDGARTAMEVLRALDAAAVEVAGLTVREPSLDDVFLSLTGRRAEPAADADPDADADGADPDARVPPGPADDRLANASGGPR